ncbi:sigma-70 family RNA polymerase sigma factor [Seongchinamella sediminis]|uniref:Sigma-70 family RNA polymerase sigma factor n=1 Tax=Seongchinamella sediminis TaxID=2283635 RepID=A0A3L7E1K3_9GAMM|nr:sigma-70 family RNA polymerase sigma factor [Seongchinamella sediminis]RLQ22022.1 sigma-70 family RNA polymerase sigma factor [Seongchinamella sediminis]
MPSLIHRLRSDEALMLAYQRGDAGAFEHLYRRHKDPLFAFLYRGCGHTAASEELAQDTWTAVINRAAGYQPRARFKTWLYRIARNRLADFWRRADNHHASLDTAREPPAPATQDQEALEAATLRAVASLPREQKDALLLREQGFSLRDIAVITASGEETVKSRLRYARGQLREQLGDLL